MYTKVLNKMFSEKYFCEVFNNKYNLNTPQLTVEYLALEKAGDDLKVLVGYLIPICIQKY